MWWYHLSMAETNLSLMTDEAKNKIRSLVMDGKEYKQIQEMLKIPPGTWDNAYYLNKYGFREFLDDVKKMRFLQEAEKVSKEITALHSDGNAKLIAIKQKEAEFLRETLGKDMGYSKRIETIGLNINKNEPLDDEQKAKLDKLVKTSGIDSIREAEVVEVDNNMAQ